MRERTGGRRRALSSILLPVLAAATLTTVACSREPAGTPNRAGGSATPIPPTPAPFVPINAKVDATGRLWVLDSTNSRLSYASDEGSSRKGWGGVGAGNTEFRNPEGLAVSGGDVYVADTWNHRVVRFTRDGEWKGAASGFMGPRGVAVGKDGSVWVSDTGNNRVVRYDGALTKESFVSKSGSEPGQFQGPVGIAVGPSGTVYVADTGNRRIQSLDPEGRFLRQWKVPWFEKTWMVQVEVGPDETVYASNPDAGEVVSFDRNGTPGRSWKTDDTGANLVRPIGIGIDSEHNVLYVSDSAANRVSKIQLSSGS